MFNHFRNLHPVDRFSRIAIVGCAFSLSAMSAVVGANALFGL
jgi:hypothetical protein